MKNFFAILTLAIASVTATFAMSTHTIRENARFLSDRMAYELGLDMMQYEDCYEINYDFISAIDRVMDDVVYGYQDAIDQYYDLLDWRNDDLRMVLTASQFARFCALEYFFRPIQTYGNTWRFRIHQIYSNHSYYYYRVPSCYHSYRGAHSHFHHANGFYGGRYHHEIAPHYHHLHGHADYHNYHHNDFGHQRHERPHHQPSSIRGDRPSQHHDSHRPGNGGHDNGHGNSHDRGHGNVGGSHDSGNHGGGQPQHRSEGSRGRHHDSGSSATTRHESTPSRDHGSRHESTRSGSHDGGHSSSHSGGSTRGGGHSSSRGESPSRSGHRR